MKKLLSFLLAIVMMFGVFSTAFAADEEFDLSYVREKSEVFEISVNAEEDCAFITSALNAKSRSFTHKNESDANYSSTQFDMLVLNYLESTRYPIFRLWIILSTETDYEYITSVSFTVEDKVYTFSDIADKDWFSTYDSGDYCQKMLIKFGLENIDFLIALESFVKTWTAEDFPDTASIKMVLHGVEDIEVSLGSGFLWDFIAMKLALTETNGVYSMEKVSDTPMKTVSAS